MRRLLAVCALAACATPDDRPTTWSYLHATIIAPGCATSNCHARSSSAAGIDLGSADDAYAQLVGRVCGAPDDLPGEPAGNFVIPYEPARSRLLYLLRGDQVDVMPPDRPLPGVEIELIERWILEGASCE